jgi:hypothetical protein
MPTPTQTLALLCALPLMWQTVPAQTLASRLNKPPAGVEEALRERVTGFFKLQSEGKFRQAERFVCADSRDAYYDSYKNRWTSVEIVSISWEDSFQTGKTLMSLGTELKTLGGTIPVKAPMTAIWKQQKDEWCYFLPPIDAAESPSPFGAMRPGPATKDGVAAVERKAPPTVGDMAGMIKISKDALNVKAYEHSTDSLEIANGLPGTLNLIIHAPEMPGLKWTLSQTELKHKEKAILTVVYKPVDPKAKMTPFNLNLLVEPFGALTTIPVNFEPLPAAPSPGALVLPKR